MMLATTVPCGMQSSPSPPVRSVRVTRPASWGVKSMPLSTTATMMCWPLVRSQTPLKPSARCAHGSLVSRARPRCDRQFRAGSGIPVTGAGGPGRTVGRGGGGTGWPVGDPDGFGVGDGVAALPAGRDLLAGAAGAAAATVRGTSAASANPDASAAPANRLIPGLPDRCPLSRQL